MPSLSVPSEASHSPGNGPIPTMMKSAIDEVIPDGVVVYSDSNPPPSTLQSYYDKRYKLFKKFDNGIWLNKEGWYSVTPEDMADLITSRMLRRLMQTAPDESVTSGKEPLNPILHNGKFHFMDAFCGPGGNVISFAKNPQLRSVTAFDISPDMLRIAQHNSLVYNIKPTKIRFVHGDILGLANVLAHNRRMSNGEVEDDIDAIFMSPPWGGVGYEPAFNVNNMPLPLAAVIKAVTSVTSNLAIMLPRTSDIGQIKAALPAGLCADIVRYIADGIEKAMVVYTGKLASRKAREMLATDSLPESVVTYQPLQDDIDD